MSFTFILIAIIFAVSLTPAFAISYQYFDLEKIDLEILDIQVLYMDDTPGYYLDNSDLLKVTINVTNHELDYFKVHDKMFKIWVMEEDYRKSTPDNEVLEIVDNYVTIYDDELEVKYDNLGSRELFEECDYTNNRVRLGQSYSFTVCFDVLRIWNNEILNLDGPKKHYLVMMDNHQATSCPNCKKVLLSSTPHYLQKYDVPDWVQNMFRWNNQGIISDAELQVSIDYLVSHGIISEIKIESTLNEKNQQLKEHQQKLSEAQKTNLYVSLSQFYESQHGDEFSGVLCKKQNNIVTLSGDYSNDKNYYNVIFFKLLVFDELGTVVSTGLSKIVDVPPETRRHFSISTPYLGEISHCLVQIDSKFP